MNKKDLIEDIKLTVKFMLALFRVVAIFIFETIGCALILQTSIYGSLNEVPLTEMKDWTVLVGVAVTVILEFKNIRRFFKDYWMFF